MSGSNRKRKSRRTVRERLAVAIRPRPPASYIAPDGKRRAADSTFVTVAERRLVVDYSVGHRQGKWRPPEPGGGP